ncbi:carbonic anhydrase [Chromobacterium sphagni]|uniref:Carbonic anhydrase n=1 Tax=Chromobacterium sphagni TaxID=1903179 RepID=A0A1S1WYT4_9NEIS|nr:carbonic anhydrase [Chromobacterium sphagni]OHX12106.1 hypothetical protein BI347_00305 [Chromobacterium sphagni]OHX21811.1 hypothetical protein BI344_04710 [Chromobacterium sphagni]
MCQHPPHAHTDCLAPLPQRPLGRRSFLRLATLGGGAALLASFLPRAAWAADGTDVLLLSCMDYRLIDETSTFMNQQGLRDKYDHIILAGASLGAVTDKYPAWNTTFWQHLQVAIDLHGVKRVMLLDHRDCGAYKVILGEDLAQDPARETLVHAGKLGQLRRLINDKYPRLKVEAYLMGMDGKVETLIV